MKQKVYYDWKTHQRQFEVGDKVLVLLPSNTSKLLAHLKDPFEIIEKVGSVDYKVRVKRVKETVFHVKMLKKWFDREEAMNESESLKVGVVGCEVTGGLYENTDEDPDLIENVFFRHWKRG